MPGSRFFSRRAQLTERLYKEASCDTVTMQSRVSKKETPGNLWGALYSIKNFRALETGVDGMGRFTENPKIAVSKMDTIQPTTSEILVGKCNGTEILGKYFEYLRITREVVLCGFNSPLEIYENSNRNVWCTQESIPVALQSETRPSFKTSSFRIIS